MPPFCVQKPMTAIASHGTQSAATSRVGAGSPLNHGAAHDRPSPAEFPDFGQLCFASIRATTSSMPSNRNVQHKNGGKALATKPHLAVFIILILSGARSAAESRMTCVSDQSRPTMSIPTMALVTQVFGQSAEAHDFWALAIHKKVRSAACGLDTLRHSILLKELLHLGLVLRRMLHLPSLLARW